MIRTRLYRGNPAANTSLQVWCVHRRGVVASSVVASSEVAMRAEDSRDSTFTKDVGKRQARASKKACHCGCKTIVATLWRNRASCVNQVDRSSCFDSIDSRAWSWLFAIVVAKQRIDAIVQAKGEL
ncbi:MAG: hypothetical protein AAF664_10125 [Planctomycetota bacterium]